MMRPGLARSRDSLLHCAGLVLLAEWRLEGQALARHLARLFQRHGVDCVFDVGANAGAFGAFLRRDVGYRGRILSVEPARQAFERLARRAAGDPLWEVRRLALGAAPGDGVLNLAADSVFNSFLVPDNALQPGLAGANRTVGTETVPMDTLEALSASVAACHPFRAAYLKLDTQGYDLEVLKGAGQALARVVALQSELSMVPIYAAMPGHLDALRRIESLGFALSGLFPVTVDPDGRLVAYDCVMVRPAGTSA